MSDPAVPAPEAPVAEAPAPEAATPPWGDASQFDAEKAWALIQNLRTDKASLSETLAASRTDLQARLDADKTEAEKMADRLKAAEATAADSRTALFVARTAAKHGLPDSVLEFLTGTTEEEIEAKAVRLVALSPPPAADPATISGARPRPALRPGAGGDAPAAYDYNAIAQAARSRR